MSKATLRAMNERTPPTDGDGAGAAAGGSSPGAEAPSFDPSDPSQLKPKLRPIRGFPAKNGEQVLLGLADAQQISDKIVFTAPAAQAILPHMTGENDLDAIVEKVGRGLTREMLEQLVAQLHDAALIDGPKFEGMLEKLRSDFESMPHLPPASTAQLADAMVVQELGEEQATDEKKAELGGDMLRKQMDAWIDQALAAVQDPSFDELPKAIVAPHLDYARGWINYAHVYGRMRVVDRPDRVVILGTNHFGMATGVCGCDKGFETPLGMSPLDEGFYTILTQELGEADAGKLIEHRYDHEREHSIELQAAWIQHVFGANENGGGLPIFAALVQDPVRASGESYDGAGLGIDAFVDAMKTAIEKSPGRTLIVSSADLSHVGPQFGDPKPLAGNEDEIVAMRNKVLSHDREMLQHVANIKPDELVTAMAWQQNPTRWCSIGNIIATQRIVKPNSVKMLNYAAAMDQQGMAMVSSCAAAMF